MPKEKLTQEQLKKLLHYDPETGVFIWKNPYGWRIKKGSAAGYISPQGYLLIGINRKYYYGHRLAWLYMEGYFPEHQIDHIDGIRYNNKFSNLRHVTNQCNNRNKPIIKTNITGVTGICWCKNQKKWHSKITVYYKGINLGYYKKFINAVKARWRAEVEHGFPNCNTTSSAYQYLKEHNAL